MPSRRSRILWLSVNAAALGAALLTAASCMSARGIEADTARPVAAGEGTAAPVAPGGLQFRGAIELPGLHSLSGLVVEDSGRRFAAITDDGKRVDGALRHDAQGRLSGIADVTTGPLSGTRPIPGRARRNDAEELVRLPDGGWLVSFERDHRIERYAGDARGPSGEPVPLAAPPSIEDTPDNGGMEAVAFLPDGRVLALEEGLDDGRPERRGWIGAWPVATRDAWKPVTYRAAPRFRPTGATVLPSGDVLVLERRVSLLGGWGARIARIPAATLRPGAVLEGEEMARLEHPLPLDNYEGISAVTGPRGETHVYVVSDDNNNPLQRTLLLMFALGGE